jgi:hypothetical protein
MDEEIKALWRSALTSGKYKKIAGDLKAGGGHCCLGVLCELHSLATGNRWTNGLRGSSVISEYLGKVKELPREVRYWAGLTLDGEERLMRLNDSGSTFLEIAEVIGKDY